MKVELATSFADAANEIDAEVGDVIELPDEIATRLVERGSASPVAVTPAGGREKASREKRERRG